ncbi:hypothetical protein PROFUN_09027 [Planoprotostelium fungivorum]|uniref:F-box domain-containing protein n=1 Tax=Planoprotostelium fungivorum TaxID=1890364 RepID=A0A2P6MUZ2_9EUKA|nr:hypothetical protein PROFUN_09027 [Planoprotostelium fungivorum]
MSLQAVPGARRIDDQLLRTDQYYDYHNNHSVPVTISAVLLLFSFFWASLHPIRYKSLKGGSGKDYREVIKRCLLSAPPYTPVSDVIEFEGSEGLPGIQVSGFGIVPLPLPPSFLITLKKTAHERSDKCWQWEVKRRTTDKECSQFWITNTDWMVSVKEEFTGIGRDHKYGENVIVIPERMILEEPGSQFSMDGDKEENDHFAYLSVILPTEHTGDNFDSCMLKRSGGHIMIRHEYECKIIETELNSKHGYKKIFYKQANLSTEPILSGQRLQIIFRLHSTEGAPPQPFHTESPLMKQLECGLKQWLEDAERPVLRYPLERTLYTIQDRNQRWWLDPSDICMFRRNDMRKLMMETMGKKHNFYHEFVSSLHGQIPSIPQDDMNRSQLTDSNILSQRKVLESECIVFYVDKEEAIIRHINPHCYQNGIKYIERLMKQRLPQDVLQHIIDRYVPTIELYNLYGASRMCRHIVSQTTWNDVNRLAEKLSLLGRYHAIFTWDHLLVHHERVKQLSCHREIIEKMCDLPKEAIEIARLYGWDLMKPRIIRRTDYDWELKVNIMNRLFASTDDEEKTLHIHSLHEAPASPVSTPSHDSALRDLRVLWESYKVDGCDPWHRIGKILLECCSYNRHNRAETVMNTPVLRQIAEETPEATKTEYEKMVKPSKREKLRENVEWLSSILNKKKQRRE